MKSHEIAEDENTMKNHDYHYNSLEIYESQWKSVMEIPDTSYTVQADLI